MKIKFLVLVLFLTNFNLISQSIDSDSLIIWSMEHPLNWKDFKMPFSKELLKSKNDPTKAISDTQIIIRTDNNKSKFVAYPVFYKQLSWTKDTTKYGLKHEQLHFDITKLYALKINNKFSKFYSEDLADSIQLYQETYKNLVYELDDFQKKYDEETYHGLNRFKQKEWEIKVETELRNLGINRSKSFDCEKCKEFKQGEFIINNKFGETNIVRNDSLQIEIIDNINYKAVQEIEWLSDCVYKLKNTKYISTPEKLKGNPDDEFIIEIIGIKDDLFTLEVTSNFSSFKTTIEMKKIGNNTE